MALINADIKLLLVNVHKSVNIGSHLQTVPFTGFTSSVGGIDIPIIIPIPLEIDINNFNLGSLLDDLGNLIGDIPGNTPVGLNTVVTAAESNIVINTSELTTPNSTIGVSLTAAINRLTNNATDPLNPDNSTANNSAFTQQPTGSTLKLNITFEIGSKLFTILGAFFDAAKQDISAFSFSYLSNEIIIFDLKLGSVDNVATEQNPTMAITFIEPTPKLATGLTNSLVSSGAESIT